MPRKLSHRFKTPWTKAQCTAVAKKYNTMLDFINEEPAAYNAAFRYGWLREFTWLERKKTDYRNGNSVKDRLIALLGVHMFRKMSGMLGEDLLLRMAKADENLGLLRYDPLAA